MSSDDPTIPQLSASYEDLSVGEAVDVQVIRNDQPALLSGHGVLTALTTGKVMTELRKLLARNQQYVANAHITPESRPERWEFLQVSGHKEVHSNMPTFKSLLMTFTSMHIQS